MLGGFVSLSLNLLHVNFGGFISLSLIITLFDINSEAILRYRL